MLLGALRRLAAIVAASALAATVLGLVIAAAAHESVRRSLALGFYVAGVCLCGLALLLSFSPPVRTRRDGGFVGFGRWVGGGVRWATHTERDEAMNLPALLLTIGVVMIVIGAAVDQRRVV